MLTKRSLVFMSLARAGTDLKFKQNLLFEFWQKCRLRLIMRKTNRQNSRLAQNKILIGVRIYSASQGQTSNLNKINTEFFIHVQTEPATERQRAVKGDWVIKILLKFLVYFSLVFALFPVSKKNPTQRMARSTPAAQASLNL